jgi:hypothetical protein
MLNIHNTIEDITLYNDLNVWFLYKIMHSIHIYQITIKYLLPWRYECWLYQHWHGSVRMKKNHISFFKLVLKNREKV